MTTDLNTPRLRFAGFHEEWERRKLSENATFTKGRGYSKADIREEGDPLLLYGNLYTDYKIDICEAPTFTEEKDNSVKSTGKEVVIPASGETAEDIARASAIKKEGIILGGDLNIITPNETIEQSFLALELTYGYAHKELVKKAQGASVVHLHNSDIKELDIFLPPLPEQQKIGAFFSSLDAEISREQERVEKLRQLKAACLQDMFPREGENAPRVRFAGFHEVWERRKLSENATFTKGRGYSKADIREEGDPLLLYGNLYTDYKIDICEAPTFTEEKDNSVKSTGKEVVIPASGETAEDIARASAIKKEGIILGGDLNIITPNETIEQSFLALELTYGYAHKELVKKAQGASVVHLHNSDIKELDIFPPTLPEQQKIGAFFSSLDAEISREQERVEKLRQLKAACLGRMFVGG